MIFASIAIFFFVALPPAAVGQSGEFYPCKTDPLSARGVIGIEEPKGLIKLVDLSVYRDFHFVCNPSRFSVWHCQSNELTNRCWIGRGSQRVPLDGLFARLLLERRFGHVRRYSHRRPLDPDGSSLHLWRRQHFRHTRSS